MTNKLIKLTGLAALALVSFSLNILAQEDTIRITKPITIDKFAGNTPPTPICVTGYSGEVAKALDFDLTVMGFKEVPAGQSEYVLTGSNGGDVQGQLTYGKTVILNKAYSGAPARALAHRLADEIVMKLTGVNGIAETKIAFAGYDIQGGGVGKKGEIYVSDYDGYNRQSVTRDDTNTGDPCWVPNRLSLYYTSYKVGAPNIFYQNLSNGDRRNFAHYPGMNTGASVSPDGHKVAMILSRSGTPEVWVADASGGEAHPLTTEAREASATCWSPDGQWVCFAARIGGRVGLYKVAASGGAMHSIATVGAPNPSEPDWSPDGKWIAFTSHAGEFGICIVPATGGNAVEIVAGQDPSWAPNSRTLVFVRRNGAGNMALSVLDVPTKQVKDVSRVAGHSNNSQPSWAR
jgi:TolB protein